MFKWLFLPATAACASLLRVTSVRLGVILWETDRTGAKESSVQSFCVACEAFGTSDSGFRVFDYKGDSTRTLPSPSKDH